MDEGLNFQCLGERVMAMIKKQETVDVPWFDPESGVLLLDERVAESPEFRTIMADGVVTDAELLDYGTRVIELLKKLDRELPPSLHKQVGDALLALAVLHALQIQHANQKEGGSHGCI